MTQTRFAEVDRYFAELFASQDQTLDAVIQANAAAGLPAYDVSPVQGKLLQLFVKLTHARRVLEIGTLGGYSTIWMARALPQDGRIVTLEFNPHHAEVARANFEQAGVAEKIELHEGAALDSLPRIAAQGSDPFDLIFIDADKPNNPGYLAWALRLSRPGTLIIGDNVVRDGAVADAENTDPNVQGVRRFLELTAREPRLSATAIQTVGLKGYDGFSLAVVS
jgi:predicted O-methyltransferase YrrM